MAVYVQYVTFILLIQETLRKVVHIILTQLCYLY